ncbi:CynX/NimT family MFS transporter [Raineyella fluvialis]|uniref:MFS transporter n=1 Tax=Raineyella fluvialis TaxID=2662261 RepID=A0A5Q2FE80_9ACTN|nr:MFS transporter [Raineyella fluvialis]QGF23774.1 MFS transporter [Raineyella fluvialis]
MLTNEQPVASSSRGARIWGLVPVVALLLMALVLRAPVAVVPPLLPQFQSALHLDTIQAALLTSIPVLCFGLLTPLVSQLVHRIGINHAVSWGLVAVIIGSLVRVEGTIVGLYAGTLLIGLGLTIGNLGMPMLISRQYRHRAALLTGASSATINIAVTLATATAVPVAMVVGWQRSSALWGTIIGGAALVVWLIVYPPGLRGARGVFRRHAGQEAPAQTVRQGRAQLRTAGPGAPLLRSPLAWLLAAAFSGHTLAYYAVTSWLPRALVDLRGLSASSAGVGASIFQAAGIVGPFVTSWLVDGRHWSLTRTALLVGASWAVLPLGIVLAPAGWMAWSLLGGLAQGAFFTLVFVIVVRRTRTVDDNRRLTAMVQTIGYSAAATGPVVMGWVHDHLHAWGPSFLVVLVAVVVMVVTVIGAARDRGRLWLAEPLREHVDHES